MDVGHHVSAGSEEHRARRRADEGLDHVIGVIDGRDLVGEKLDQLENLASLGKVAVGEELPPRCAVRSRQMGLTDFGQLIPVG